MCLELCFYMQHCRCYRSLLLLGTSASIRLQQQKPSSTFVGKEGLSSKQARREILVKDEGEIRTNLRCGPDIGKARKTGRIGVDCVAKILKKGTEILTFMFTSTLVCSIPHLQQGLTNQRLEDGDNGSL